MTEGKDFIVLPNEEIKVGDPFRKWAGGRWKYFYADEFQVKLINELWNEATYEKIKLMKK